MPEPYCAAEWALDRATPWLASWNRRAADPRCGTRLSMGRARRIRRNDEHQGGTMIVITTPAGNIGRQVLENLLDSGEQLRLVARDPAVVAKAFDGADAVFWLVPPDPRADSVEAAYTGFTRPAAEAFTRHGV